MINVGRQAQTGIAATLVGGHYQTTVLYLELHQRQTRLLVGLCARFTQKQHIVLAVLLFCFDFLHQCRQFPEIGRVTVMQRISAVVPPRRSALVAMMPPGGIGRPRLLLSSSQIFDLRRRFFIFAFGAVLLCGGDTCFKHLEFGAEFLAGNTVRLEDVEQVGRREVQDLIGEVLDRTFLVGLPFALGHDTREGLIILVHNYAAVWWLVTGLVWAFAPALMCR